MAQQLEEERIQEPQELNGETTAHRPPRRSAGDEETQERPPAQRKSFFRGHPLKIALALITLAVLAVGGLMYWNYRSSFEDTDDAQVDGHIYPVSARIAGRVTDVKVDNNVLVNAGQVLVQLDPTDYQVELHSAQADVAQAQADAQAAQTQIPITTTTTSSQISTATAGVQEANVAISVAQQQYEAALARIREAEANAAKAERDVDRYRPLAEKQEISQQQFDQAVANARALSATVDTARANADAAKRQVAQAEARLAQAQAQAAATKSTPQQIAAQRARANSMLAAVGAKQATVQQAQLNLQYTTVTAPVRGVVGQRAVQAGQQIQPGQELMSVIPLNDLWVTANFKETQLQNMRVGQPVTIHVDAIGQDYKGHVDSFPGATGAKYSLLPPENATGNFVKVVQRLPVRILFEQGEDPQHRLRPGMSVEAKVRVK
jgi:membrane fusion protein (multidrug efflux system)